jgi:hypothetical protein
MVARSIGDTHNLAVGFTLVHQFQGSNDMVARSIMLPISEGPDPNSIMSIGSLSPPRPPVIGIFPCLRNMSIVEKWSTCWRAVAGRSILVDVLFHGIVVGVLLGDFLFAVNKRGLGYNRFPKLLFSACDDDSYS